MYKAILLSIGEPITLGIYYTATHTSIPQLIFILRVKGKASHVLPLLFAPFCVYSKYSNDEALSLLLQPHILASCTLCECIVDSSFFTQHAILRHSLQNLDIQFCDSTQYALTDTKEYLYRHYHIDIGTYRATQPINFMPLCCTLDKALHLLAYLMPLHAIYYARGVGSLSAIKLTHVFLHTLALSMDIGIYATNSFYFSKTNEIKAFANMSFFLDISQTHAVIADEHAHAYIQLATSTKQPPDLHLPYFLMHGDFLESCTPLYVTPAV